ncbi:hypothetical protein EV650_2290 [Kribbella kalugense]|uniref:Uncharacterized protein n=1 Tax=Kribbella kalugense TaxID=2512221 RepID=A0A4R8A003_9ACTN|nr:hypothetical protein EV650_2290 [Kribbella kalugense]
MRSQGLRVGAGENRRLAAAYPFARSEGMSLGRRVREAGDPRRGCALTLTLC